MAAESPDHPFVVLNHQQHSLSVGRKIEPAGISNGPGLDPQPIPPNDAQQMGHHSEGCAEILGSTARLIGCHQPLDKHPLSNLLHLKLDPSGARQNDQAAEHCEEYLTQQCTAGANSRERGSRVQIDLDSVFLAQMSNQLLHAGDNLVEIHLLILIQNPVGFDGKLVFRLGGRLLGKLFTEQVSQHLQRFPLIAEELAPAAAQIP